jgi:hypothetical protein
MSSIFKAKTPKSICTMSSAIAVVRYSEDSLEVVYRDRSNRAVWALAGPPVPGGSLKL